MAVISSFPNCEVLCTILREKKSHRGYNYIYFKKYDGSVGKESTCNAGDPSLVPGLGRSTGEEGIGYPLQYSWAALVAQPVKNLPAMQETPV